MTRVRTILSEQHHDDGGITRRYLMEDIPASTDIDQSSQRDGKLIELELRLSPGAAIYFHNAPYTLAEEIWFKGLREPWCCYPFCCAEYPILFYSEEAYVDDLTDWKTREPGGLITLEVYTTWDQMASAYRLPVKEVLAVEAEIRQMGEQGNYWQVKHALSDIGHEPIAPWRWRDTQPSSNGSS